LESSPPWKNLPLRTISPTPFIVIIIVIVAGVIIVHPQRWKNIPPPWKLPQTPVVAFIVIISFVVRRTTTTTTMTTTMLLLLGLIGRKYFPWLWDRIIGYASVAYSASLIPFIFDKFSAT
jgi:hypothetical protein